MTRRRTSKAIDGDGVQALNAPVQRGVEPAAVQPPPISQPPPSRERNDRLGGLIPPAEMFGRVLFERFIPDADLPFEERVERALRHIELTRFTEDEHERLREVLAEKIEEELKHA
jgi:hypothetical protein